MTPVLKWLQARADNVAVALLTAMFLSFILQIFSRYVLNQPLGWTLEACLLAWLWVVFWGAAFLLKDSDHVRFDMLYTHVRPGVRRFFALVAAIAIVAGFTMSFPASADFISFMRIEKSSMLGIRFDYVFSCYLIFAAAIIVRYFIRAIRLSIGQPMDDPVAPDGSEPIE